MLISLSLTEPDTLKILKEEYNLRAFNFLARGHIKDALRTITLKITQSLETNQLQEITQEVQGKVYKFYMKVDDGLVCMGCIQEEYPIDLIDSVLDKVKDSDLKSLMNEYKDPKKFNTTEKIAKELEDTKVILTRTLESVMLRGEKLGELTDSAQKLEIKSKKLFEKAKDQNKCCRFL